MTHRPDRRLTGAITRRSFLQSTAALAAAMATPLSFSDTARRLFASNEKLRIGVIGVGNRGFDNLMGVKTEHIAALCDVDDTMMARAAKEFPEAKHYIDFREMIDARKELDLDAVVVSTPDHTHAPAAAMALRNRLHVYCEKPLTHTVHEARVLAQLARKYDRVTQMGTQIHAGGNYRRVVELIRTGAIGQVSEVHVFCDKTWSGGERPADTPPVPKTLHYDLWLGPAPYRPYHSAYHPAGWRRWWDFGGGTLADMGCHYLDLAHWALELTTPVGISARGPKLHRETTPTWLEVTWNHPHRGGRRAVDVTWYDGSARAEVLKKYGLEAWTDGVFFVGENGWLIADYGRHQLGPAADFDGFTPPDPFLPDSIGHHAEWIAACKDRRPTTCNFDYAGALTETVLLGNIAYRAGETLRYDRVRVDTPGCEYARNLLHRWYRSGWSL